MGNNNSRNKVEKSNHECKHKTPKNTEEKQVLKYTVTVSTENTITTHTTNMMSINRQSALTKANRERKVN